MKTDGAILSNRKKKAIIFLSLDDQSKQIYKVEINNIQRHDPGQIKKEGLSGDISKFPPVTYPWYLIGYFLFSLSPLTKKELKRYESLECYNHLASGWAKETK